MSSTYLTIVCPKYKYVKKIVDDNTLSSCLTLENSCDTKNDAYNSSGMQRSMDIFLCNVTHRNNFEWHQRSDRAEYQAGDH